MTWQTHLDEYQEAEAHCVEADRLYHRTARSFDRLAHRVGDARAWLLAGMSLADARCVQAEKRRQRAYHALRAALTPSNDR
jgi:hypothetical protein